MNKNSACVVVYSEIARGVVKCGMRSAHGGVGLGLSTKAASWLYENGQHEQIMPKRIMRVIKGLKNVGKKKTTPPPAAEEVKPVIKAASNGGPVKSGARPAKPVTIEAKIDVGFGNSLYLRGEGLGLDWNRGIPLTCEGGSTWKWSCEASEALKFKLLLNDAVWAKGEDLVATPGERIEVAPKF